MYLRVQSFTSLSIQIIETHFGITYSRAVLNVLDVKQLDDFLHALLVLANVAHVLARDRLLAEMVGEQLMPAPPKSTHVLKRTTNIPVTCLRGRLAKLHYFGEAVDVVVCFVFPRLFFIRPR